MAEQDDQDQKQFEPTQKKLEDARKKGEVPRSADLNSAAAYGGLLLAMIAFGYGSFLKLGETLSTFIARAPELSLWLGGNARNGLGAFIRDLLTALAPVLIIPLLAVCLSVVAQRSFVVAPTKLQPKLSRISPLSNAKNKFGRQGLFEFAKSATKLMIFCVILGLFLMSRNNEILGAISLQPAHQVSLLGKISVDFLALVFVVALSIGAVDFGWQYTEHMRKNRMTRQELMDEAKQSEGDPHMRQKRRQRAQEIATNKMLADVPKASVVIVNPTHYATALKWDRSQKTPPVCVAKGVDEIAARIRELAIEHAVPIHSDPPTARAIHKLVEVGHPIPTEHFRAVAVAIRFADDMRKKKGRGWRKP